MTGQTFLTYWTVGLVVAVIIVVMAAALLITIFLIARSIERGAGAALGIVKQIRENTKVIWLLQDTNRVALQLSEGADSILAHAGRVAQALHDADVRRGRAR